MFEIFEEDDWKVICPKVNIKGTVADKFRELIRDLSEEGVDRYKFDFARLTDIDVVGLCVFIVINKTSGMNGKISEYEVINTNNDIQNLFLAMKINLKNNFQKVD